ncbi:MAG: L-histidine N(alpha)-methyltransferase [Planctomycetes bacterium]|nr:L-histidine N(alpha)-methyltransferase [Planctomycetota bacterium]
MTARDPSTADPTSAAATGEDLLRPVSPGAVPAAQVLTDGLQLAQPAIPFGFLYDELGSRLFTAITALDEYYPTRTEAAILQEQLPAITAARAVAGATMIDLGAGNCEKAAALFAAVRPAHYVAVDVSVDFLASALAALRMRFPDIEMTGVGLDFSQHLPLPDSVPGRRRLFFYPGSSIGNFSPPRAVRFLTEIRRQMDADGTLWIGVDLHKDRTVLERAYDDELGVTAAFIRNVLRNVNRIANTDFRLDDWRYVARYDEDERRVIMWLETRRAVTVRWPGGERRFDRGDPIHIENAYKHTIDGFTDLLERAGMRRVGCWTDARDWYGFFAAAPA